MVPPDDTAFEVVLGEPGECTVVHIHGAFDWVTSPPLKANVERLWDSLRGGCLVLDLGPMSFCDSTGVGTLIELLNGCRERGVRLVLAAPPAYLRGMLTTTGLIELFEVTETVEQALQGSAGGEAGAGHPSPSR
ncbi:STAS domain-containing protein [Planobispora siamensis]|uniref:Anti-sigma factor antagonist n=1 Tax=Planobispora siamensis TaxID=936338 RepID=A0A8J3SR94_9ACTN|nr:STAS domain-containing protein [Planobispora siamensis]GIH97874.1 hypothetical protein Psi01_85040 [Planobispora siamensis]